MERTAKNADEYSYLQNFEHRAGIVNYLLEQANDHSKGEKEAAYIRSRCWIEFHQLTTLENYYRPATLVAAN